MRAIPAIEISQRNMSESGGLFWDEFSLLITKSVDESCHP